VVGDAGVAVAGTPDAFADGVRELMSRPEPQRRAAARSQAEGFGWQQAVDGFLRAHGVVPEPAAAGMSIARQRPAAVLRPAVPRAVGNA
jgi:alpha-1,6-mannosyltransferase